ncbi:MAG: fibrillarin-like rRNA/tRNA 2'-O-methyltransferase [Candidatus Diapherotrites archaeon]|uniref:Fibrillarin-like rRNA/tRNA 2'-O-methyltransferase n=1 Tax=Candidatus Iainarchaeum sp. TaxID=3101447 RepID=A0A938YNT5_9ARCH|nr:fibrillarin-like rRNA/tRNA 2'-O-methyltransferase [Candidatus Diapherotrites archaeon]
MEEIFPNVFSERKELFTKNLVPGTSVYGEKLLDHEGIELRQWDQYRSKLAAAIKNGLSELPIKPGSVVLYLGAAEGTTISHVSDIVGGKGIVIGVDISERVMRKFIMVCEQRKNIVPILADANRPWTYRDYFAGGQISVLYQDVSQKNQAQIFLKNSEYFLKKGGYGMLAIKAKSISQEKPVNDIFESETAKLNEQFNVLQKINLKPFEKDHEMVFCRKKE